MHIDLYVLELLSSKLCHDLISPVSAINNGVELIEDIGSSVEEEAMNLIGNSAVQAARRLRIFRIAYGRAGSEANLPFRDVRQVTEQYFEGGKIKLTWSQESDWQSFSEQKGAFKVLINALIMAEEILAYGGSIALQRLSGDDKIGCRLEISGRNAALSPAFQAALEVSIPIEELTPRTIQPYITGRFVSHFGLRMTYAAPEPDRLDLSIELAPPEYDKHQEE